MQSILRSSFVRYLFFLQRNFNFPFILFITFIAIGSQDILLSDTHRRYVTCECCFIWLYRIFRVFFYQVFFHRHWRFTGQQGKGGDHLLFHTTTSTRSRTLRHLFAILHVRWLSRIFNRNACVYQTATQWDLPPYRITIWLIDDAMFVCLLDELILGFRCSDLTWETGGFKLASTITLVLQANGLTKCASRPEGSSSSLTCKRNRFSLVLSKLYT